VIIDGGCLARWSGVPKSRVDDGADTVARGADFTRL
jgi:hypothetical protein